MRESYRKWRSLLLDASLAAAIALYGIGLFAPLFTVNKLLIFTDTVSIASSLLQLFEQRYWFLFALVMGFSVLLPAGKLAVLAHLRWMAPPAHSGKWLSWIERFGKWSMLDVFVVAMLVVSIKLNVIAAVTIHYGLYAFACSVMLTMVVAARLIAGHARSRGQTSVLAPPR